MVKLNRIYTRTGDAGETALGDGSRVAKFSLRVAGYGTVDETNATVGLARLSTGPDAILDPIMAVVSLGNGGQPTTYNFDAPLAAPVYQGELVIADLPRFTPA